jgi:hypothetical protein
VRSPTLMIAHPDDELHPVPSAEHLDALIPRSRLIVAPDAWYYSVHRDELMETIKTFLNGD